MNFLRQNLIYVRKKFRVTQSQLAFQLGKSQSTINGYEKGSAEPNVDFLIGFSDLFGISIDWLIRDDLASGNLIPDSAVSEFKANGKVIGKLSGNVLRQNQASKAKEDHTGEAENLDTWTIISILKGIDTKVDKILKSKPE